MFAIEPGIAGRSIWNNFFGMYIIGFGKSGRR